MKIIFLARRFYPLIGGVEKHVLEVSKLLIKQGHSVTVITEAQKDLPRHEILKPSGIHIYRITAGKEKVVKKFHIWKAMWNLQHVLLEADVIHCHDVFFWYLPFRFLYPRKPVYTTFHGYESYPVTKRAIWIRKLSEKLSWGNICIGDFIAKWYGTNPTVVSYGAVERAKSKEQRVKSKKESAIFIGRVDEQTGILTYTKAVELLRKKYPKFRFLIVGDGKYKKKVSRYARVTGFQNNPERYYATYRFAFVSRYLAILEAFAAKRLVFAAYDNPIKEDYLKMAPFASYMVIAKSADELSKKIIYYMNNQEEEEKLIKKAFEWSQKQTWDNMVKKYLLLWSKEIYEKDK